MSNSDEVTISRERYNELLRQEAFLVALESAGVDNCAGMAMPRRCVMISQLQWMTTRYDQK